MAILTALLVGLPRAFRRGRDFVWPWGEFLSLLVGIYTLGFVMTLRGATPAYEVAAYLAASGLGLSVGMRIHLAWVNTAALVKVIRLRRAAGNASDRPEAARARESDSLEQAEGEGEQEAPHDDLRDQDTTGTRTFERPELSQLADLIRCGTLPWGTIGLVGIRGVGKTTIQRQLLDNLDDDRSVTFSVACPAGDATEREIVTNIFDRLCHAVLARFRREFEEEIPGLKEVALRRRGYDKRRMMLTLGIIQGLLAGGLATYWLFRSQSMLWPAGQRLAVAIAGGSAVASAVVWMVWGSIGRLLPIEVHILHAARRRGMRSSVAEELALLYARTMREISRLEVDQKLTTADIQSLQPWSGTSFSRSHETETRQLALTLPGLIDAYIAYVESGVRTYYQRIVIAIDELDRIADPEVIRKFLRSLKSLFQVAGVYYVMSVSEDVIQSFDLQSIAAKGEADSAFTEIVRLKPLTVGEGIQFLRALGHDGLPRSYAAATTLAAGIPRDILRYHRLHRSCAERAEESETRDHQGTYSSFIEAVEGRWKADFLRFVRHSTRFSPREKLFFAGIASKCDATEPKSVLLDILPQVSTSEWNARRQGSDAPAMTLAVEYLIRMCVVARLRGLRIDDEDALEAQLAPLCKAMEIHSYSPLEALHLIAD